MIYGALPEDMGLIDLSPIEMMCWMYCPISTPTEGVLLPDNLRQFWPIVEAVANREHQFGNRFVYLTAKTLWVAGECVGNRPGWHSDGFGTDDVNYIWYDRAPTQFLEASFELPEGCDDAMAVMDQKAKCNPVVTFPDKHLLRLTPSVVHRVAPSMAPGMRTFVKVSVSTDRYNLEGNSVNHLFRERWPLVPRNADRNHPVKVPQ